MNSPDHADNLLETMQGTKDEKFKIYRSKLEKFVTEQDYVS